MANEKRLIDANELLDFVKGLKFHGGTKTRTQAGQEVLDIHLPHIVAKIPTVDAEPVVHGRWVAKETMIRSPFVKNYYCSECKTEGSPQWKRCPVCEAKMDGKEKDSNLLFADMEEIIDGC